jgi:2-dehydro-3-deoxygluconokinase
VLVSVGEPLVELTCSAQGAPVVGVAGDALNVAARAAAVGAASALVTVRGDDPLAPWLTEEAARLGVRLLADRECGRTGIYALRSGVDKQYAYWRTSSAGTALSPRDADRVPAASRVVVTSGLTQAVARDGVELSQALAARARACGAVFAVDPNVRPALWGDRGVAAARAATEAVLREVDWLLPSVEDCMLLWDCSGAQEAVAMLSHLSSGCVLKLGAEGVAVIDGRGVRRFAAHPTEVVDTTGAGDAFDGAFLGSLALGRPTDAAVEAGLAAAAACVRSPGALTDLLT